SPNGAAPEEHDVDSGTLLGAELTVAGAVSPRVWRTRLDHDSRPYPGSHPIHGVEVVPAAVLLQTFLAAGGTGVLTDVRLKVPVTVAGEQEIHVVRQDTEVSIASRRIGADGQGQGGEGGAGAWSVHTVASLRDAEADATLPGAGFDLHAELPELSRDAVVKRLETVGVGDIGFPWETVALAGDDARLRARLRL
ncbi:polyketide synthase dehydratase domain-containing protein, partial [Streptomyces sp. T-3]|nr:polyketide synthase dehydratase domain-containing protein [Streptomyces sp. T-3]